MDNILTSNMHEFEDRDVCKRIFLLIEFSVRLSYRSLIEIVIVSLVCFDFFFPFLCFVGITIYFVSV